MFINTSQPGCKRASIEWADYLASKVMTSTMTKDETIGLLSEVEKVFDREPNLIRIESGRAVFVGDTHGDLEATSKVIGKYLNSENRIVFLGDYVDRGPDSMENLNTLLSLKLKYPDNLFLLMGNHEGYQAIEFRPADFWDSLDRELHQRYSAVLAKLPLVVSSPNGVIALHGALPDVQTLKDIDRIEFGSQHWQQITWGDWRENEGGSLGNDLFTARPQFGQDWFEEIMGRLKKNVLIRSHQPDTRQVIYDRRCLTIFTSAAYGSSVLQKTIAIADLEKEIRTVDDLTIENI